MATYLLPIGDTVDSNYRVEIEGSIYSFRFRWNAYDESWKCYLGLIGNDPVTSFKMTVGSDLLTPYRHMDEVPNAALVVIDTIKNSGRVDKDNVGTEAGDRYKVLLVTET